MEEIIKKWELILQKDLGKNITYDRKVMLEMLTDFKSVVKLFTDDEPYFGWCNVKDCKNEGANGGGCWRETGYWTVCSKHSAEYRAGKAQPQMKQSAIEKEKMRGEDGILRG